MPGAEPVYIGYLLIYGRGIAPTMDQQRTCLGRNTDEMLLRTR